MDKSSTNGERIGLVSTDSPIKNSKIPKNVKLTNIAKERLDAIFIEAEDFLAKGASSAAVELLSGTFAKYKFQPDRRADLSVLLSYSYETLGHYDDALNVISEYDDEKNLEELDVSSVIRTQTQLALALNNKSDQPKAAAILNKSLEIAKENETFEQFGDIYIALARVYRKLHEFSIARDYAETGRKYHREYGNWRGIAESYQLKAMCFQQEGDIEKAVNNFQLAINIIGERNAPYMLGKLYSDIAGAYWFLRQPQEGIKFLEKSIAFFDKTEHKIQSVAAYNNLGINLMLLGEWEKAEIVIKKSLDLAKEIDHAHIAGIFDSLGELKLLKGKFEEAKDLFKEGVRVAEEKQSKWNKIQNLKNLAQTYLATKENELAEQTAEKTLELCETGEQIIANGARLVLAEVYLRRYDIEKSEEQIDLVEDTDPRDDFAVLGKIQIIRGKIALSKDNRELAEHHFKRALTIFETAEDLFHTALTHYQIGRTIGRSDTEKAFSHLIAASQTFRSLGITNLFEKAEQIISNLKSFAEDNPNRQTSVRTNNAGSQLLMVRLAEATASRELLFRELVAVLQQESRAKRIILAEYNEQNRLYPFISHDFLPAESLDLTEKYIEALQKKKGEQFCKTKNIKVFELKTPNSATAFLMIYPISGALLNDGGSLIPLLRVVQLGMDVCSLRNKERPHLSQTEEEDETPFISQSLMPGFIHSSPAMTSLVEEVYKIRSSDVTVLVTGESGTGKELVSRAIHIVSNRKDKVFVPFNCTAVPKELAEGHLFGYRRGAFTGAVNDSQGMVRAADGGTLFLDEVGDLPLDVQPKLLRFLQEGEVQPIGEKTPLKVDVRIIAATNMPLEKKVADGSFREDLYYRLNVIRLRVPPLRERRSEVPPMVNYYINHYSTRFGKRDITITPQAMDLLMVGDWDGNVRQLCNEVQRMVARAVDGEVITPDHLSAELLSKSKSLHSFGEDENVKSITSYNGSFFGVGKQGFTIEQAVSELETEMIIDALRRHDGNISRTAKELGLTRRGLYMKIERYEIERAA